MNILHRIIDACISILEYQIEIFGYSFSLMTFSIWCCIVSFLLWLVGRIFK